VNIEHRHGQVVAGHLGGYVPGGGPNTTYPDLWRWLVENLGVRSVLDVGCGDGKGALDAFAALGCDVLGIDGIPQDDERIETHDFATGPWKVRGNRIEGAYDLVWSAEFVEHVDERYVPNFLDTFTAAPLVLMTHAVPGQGGHHHVNCRTEDYWIGALAAIGYRLDASLSATTRLLATSPGSYSYYAATGLAFRREG
jgi:hypothetical protein